MKKTVSLAVAILLAFTLLSCGAEEYTDRVIEGADAYATLRMSNVSASGGRLSEEYFDTVGEGCGRLVAKCDRLMSDTSDRSQMYALNNTVDMIVSPDDSLISVFETALTVADATEGAYIPTAGALSDLWTDGVPDEEAVADALKHISTDLVTVGYERIEKKDDGCKIDLSGISEGFTAQRLLEYLSAAEVAYGVVSVGDSVGVFGEKKNGEAFKIGIKSPENTEATIAYYSISGGFISVACSADGEIIDPTDGYPADSGVTCAAVWATGGAVSDALSDAVTVLGEAGTAELYQSRKITFEAILVTESKEIILTDGISEESVEVLDSGYTVRKITQGE